MNLRRPWGQTHYLDDGDGPLVVCLHPLAASGQLWRPLIDELREEHRVVAPDARGHGASSWDGEQFSVADLADDVAALVSHLDAGPARLISLSMGGCTAVDLAARHPGTVHSLVLADTTADYGPGKEEVWAERADKAINVPRAKQLGFQVDRWFTPDFAASDPEEVERVSSIFLDTDGRAHAAACRALGAFDDRDLLGNIDAPTLVLVGEDDYATPPEMARTLNDGIADSSLHILPDTRHMSLIESPTARSLVRKHLLR
ncbi:MAG TPA: alpha/beta fold hydrolase [Nocardioidaceae bacterium]|nr:alpha/beta fold hydrolase [Nocardioidaceae bacterium]